MKSHVYPFYRHHVISRYFQRALGPLLLLSAYSLIAVPGAAEQSKSNSATSTHERKPARARRGWLGISLEERGPGQVFVDKVLRGSPAFQAKFRSHDRILRVGNKQVYSAGQAQHLISSHPAGSQLWVMVLRSGKPLMLQARLTRIPNPEQLMRMRLVGLRSPRLRGLKTAMNTNGPTLRSFRGKVLVIDFWASWCPPCRLTARHMNTWYDKYHSKGLQVIGVAGEPVASASAAMAEFGMKYHAYADPDQLTVRGFHIPALPSLVIIDKAGVVRDATVGFDPPRLREMEQLVKKLLAEPDPSSKKTRPTPAPKTKPTNSTR